MLADSLIPVGVANENDVARFTNPPDAQPASILRVLDGSPESATGPSTTTINLSYATP